MLLPISPEPFVAPTDRDMLPSERRLFVRTHRTCVLGYGRLHEDRRCPSCTTFRRTRTSCSSQLLPVGPRLEPCSVTRRSASASSTSAGLSPYLQVYANAVIDPDRKFTVDVLMAVVGRM